MANSIYNEYLKSGGILSITNDGWKIVFELLDCNNRKNGTTASIGSVEVDDCVKELINAYGIYQALLKEVPLGSAYRTTGPMGLVIVTTRKNAGIYLSDDLCQDCRLIVREENDLNRLLKDFLYCKVRALNIQEMMNDPLVDNAEIEETIQELKKEYEFKIEKVSDVLPLLSPVQQISKNHSFGILDILFVITAVALVIAICLLAASIL